MTFFDWSDSEELLGLLVEFVADAQHDANDPERRRFLSGLRRLLEELQDRFTTSPLAEGIESLRGIRRGLDRDFEDDPVVEHLDACIEELERIDRGRS